MRIPNYTGIDLAMLNLVFQFIFRSFASVNRKRYN